MKKFLLTAALLLPCVAGASTLYKCIDDTGVVLYTNQKVNKKSCTVLSYQSPPPTASGTTAPRHRAAATPTPADFPRVSNNEQRSRDSDRKLILDRELANEQQSMDKAKKALLDAGNQPADRLQPLRDTLALHERNVEALKKELAKLR